jgi:leader peptidase (prepilin peptidase)/N-methyltransferase
MLDAWSLRPLTATPAWEALAFVVGLIVGSFANVCIHRLPLDVAPADGRLSRLRELARQALSVVHPPSRCPSCGAAIRAWQNVPLVSYALLRGRCAACRHPISPRYPAVELANGLLYLGVALQQPFGARALVTAGLLTALLVLSLIDLDHKILPDVITLPGIVVGLAVSFLPDWPVTPLAAVLSALGGYLAFAAVAEAYRRVRGVEGLGRGDWKLVALLGAFLGWERLLLVVLLATLAGSLIGLWLMAFAGRDGRHELPLGTFLGAAGIAVVFVGEPLLAWYRGLFLLA